MLKTYKFRISPNNTTANKLQWVLDRCREVYNAALQERKDTWEVIKHSPNYYDVEWRRQAAKEHDISYSSQQNQLPEIKEIREEYQEIGAHVLQNVCKRVDLAFKAFFRRIKAGQTPGYPRFMGKNRYTSFTYPDKAGWKLEGNMLHLTKIGGTRVKLHRPVEGKMKTCTIKREGDHWYMVVACEVEASKLPLSYEDVGIDLGVTHFATLSDGMCIDNPKHYRSSEKKLAQLQQALAKKKRGSHRRQKAVKQVAKAHRKVRNQRKDFLDKESRKLVNRYQVVVFEDLQPANLVRRPKPKQDETGKYLPNGAAAKGGLNKSLNDAGWAQFVEYCSYKAANAGRAVLFVNPKYTSQACSGCGQVRKKELSERWHSCDCGTELDRDHNAAINILRLGRSQQSARVVEAPCL